MAVIPAGADTDGSYQAKATMTDAAGNTYYVQKTPTPPVTAEGTTLNSKIPHASDGSGDTAPDVTPNIAVARDTDRRKQNSAGGKIAG